SLINVCLQRSEVMLLRNEPCLQTPPAQPAHATVCPPLHPQPSVTPIESSAPFQMEVKAARRRALRKRRGKQTEEEEEPRDGASESDEEEASVGVEIDRQLDQSLESKSKQHNLTTVNVRNIIHEVITNEHVVAMMKAAINETEAIPPFEPKMTRSRFKEVVEKGVVIPAWNISPIKKNCDAPQFVDIPLAEEDSSDEEYRPDEEEEDETAEDVSLRSDWMRSDWLRSDCRSRISKTEFVSMGPPPPPKAPLPTAVTDSSFLEKLHAVEEELAVCMEPYQVGLMAYRTRSKRPLRDVPLGRLEAELRAPDITPDMYDSSSTHEDREWTDWLRGLMSSDVDNEEECDDEDDPEYNFLADIDEPDLEDYRDDKAVRITSMYTQTHVQLLTQIHLLTSPVIRLQSEAETTRQFLVTHKHTHAHFLLMSAMNTSLMSVVCLVRCHPVLPAELAWIFSTRPVFVHPELLPRVSLDPDLFCPRRTSVFTAAEDCLLVLGLRNMEGSCDPTKLVSQFLLRKTLVQIRRRILQCCRPGFPDNIVKVTMTQSHPNPKNTAHMWYRRSPVEREESVLPLWLVVGDGHTAGSRLRRKRKAKSSLPCPNRRQALQGVFLMTTT
uniref:Uncharacterized protein n=1 Tax=Echeneis naucrates TaxID=173247 RepID=A0A665TWA0_ECHNA